MHAKEDVTPLCADELRSLAKAFVENQHKKKIVQVQYSSNEIQSHIQKLKGLVRESAQSGHLECFYSFSAEEGDLMHAVSASFRRQVGEGFMIITRSSGRNQIHVRWDGNYHV